MRQHLRLVPAAAEDFTCRRAARAYARPAGLAALCSSTFLFFGLLIGGVLYRSVQQWNLNEGSWAEPRRSMGPAELVLWGSLLVFLGVMTVFLVRWGLLIRAAVQEWLDQAPTPEEGARRLARYHFVVGVAWLLLTAAVVAEHEHLKHRNARTFLR
jgi:hypothetical protein